MCQWFDWLGSDIPEDDSPLFSNLIIISTHRQRARRDIDEWRLFTAAARFSLFSVISELKFFLNELLVLRSIRRRLFPLRISPPPRLSDVLLSVLERWTPSSRYLSAVIVTRALFFHQLWEHFRGNIDTRYRSARVLHLRNANDARGHFSSGGEYPGYYMRR